MKIHMLKVIVHFQGKQICHFNVPSFSMSESICSQKKHLLTCP